MSETHTDLAHEVALATGVAADTDIAVPRISEGDVVKSIYTLNGDATVPAVVVWAVTDILADLTIVGDGVIQVSSDTSDLVVVIVFNKHSQSGKSLVDPSDPLYVAP